MAESLDFTRFQDATTVFLIMYRYIQIDFNIYGTSSPLSVNL